MSITVIGGGVIGLSAALFLQAEGLKVRMIDPNIAEGRCSYGNAGAISPGSVAPLALPGVLAKVPSMIADPTAPYTLRRSICRRLFPG
jgi:D-amino-acid dehydrogenase